MSEGAIRLALSDAAVYNVLEERYEAVEYETLKANQGRALHVWRVHLAVCNGSGRELDLLRADSWSRSYALHGHGKRQLDEERVVEAVGQSRIRKSWHSLGIGQRTRNWQSVRRARDRSLGRAVRADEYTPNADRWGRRFRDFPRAIYRLFEPNRGVLCFVEDYPGKAYSDLESDKREAWFRDNEVIETRWAPGAASASGDSAATMPLRDFHVAVASGERTVRVCVRDHECEDGDRVRVAVNGSAVFSGEIVNAWACRSVPVSEGRNSIELYAVNGAGRKGNCSYADSNTGQIRVEGLSIETQGWKHRGGAGSSASLMVTVR